MSLQVNPGWDGGDSGMAVGNGLAGAVSPDPWSAIPRLVVRRAPSARLADRRPPASIAASPTAVPRPFLRSVTDEDLRTELGRRVVAALAQRD